MPRDTQDRDAGKKPSNPQNPMHRLLTLGLCLAAPAVVFGQQEAAYQGKTVSQWITELSEGDDQARWRAAYALGQIGPRAAVAVEPLGKILEDTSQDEYVRGGTAWALGRIGSAAVSAVPRLTKALESKQHLSVRRNAPQALGRIGAAARPAVPALMKLLDDEDRGVRANTAVALWRIERHPRAIRALVEMLQTGTGTAPYKAAIALGTLGPDAEPAVPALTETLGRADHDAARAAARALGQVGPAAIPALKEALNDPNEQARRYAAEALGWIGPPAVPSLIEALRNEKPPVRAVAARTLGRLGPKANPAVAALIEAVDDPDSPVRTAAGRALSQIRTGSGAKKPASKSE